MGGTCANVPPMGQREEFIQEHIIGNPEKWEPEAVRSHRWLAWPFQSSYGIGLGERAARSAVRHATAQAIVAKHVLAQVKEQAVFALLSEGYSIREIAAAIDLPKSEVGRIAKSLGGVANAPDSHATAAPLMGGSSAVRDQVVASWAAAAPGETPGTRLLADRE